MADAGRHGIGRKCGYRRLGRVRRGGAGGDPDARSHAGATRNASCDVAESRTCSNGRSPADPQGYARSHANGHGPARAKTCNPTPGSVVAHT